MPSMTNMSSMNTTTPPTSPPLSPRTIVPPMTPTRVPSNPIPSIRGPTEAHESRTDLDPTEWKPVILGAGSSLASSEAWNYLSRFHGGDETLLARRSHRSTTSLPALVGGTPAPSLTNTPSMASSYSSTASDYLGSMYETNRRPLPPRHKPSFPSSAATKGVELVVPHIATTPDIVAVEMSDSGSIFPASSAVWEDACEKSRPIDMIRSVQARAQEA